MGTFSSLPHLLGQHGSAWLAVQHLRVLNAMSVHDVARFALGVGTSSGRRAEHATRSLLDLQWYEDRVDEGFRGDERIDDAVSSQVRKRGLDFQAGALASLLGRDDAVRWCPQCLALGYHSAWFQLAALRACPLHQRLLEDRCADCGAPHEPCALAPGHSAVFECSQCGRTAANADPRQWTRDPDFASAERAAFAPLADWLKKVQRRALRWRGLANDFHVCGKGENDTDRRAARLHALLALEPSAKVASLCGPVRRFTAHSCPEWPAANAWSLRDAAEEAFAQVHDLAAPHLQCAAEHGELILGTQRMMMPAHWPRTCCIHLAYQLWCARYLTDRERYRTDARIGMPLQAAKHLLLGDFLETVRTLTQYRVGRTVSKQRVSTALSMSSTPDLGGIVLASAKSDAAWWVIHDDRTGFPAGACSQRSRSATKTAHGDSTGAVPMARWRRFVT